MTTIPSSPRSAFGKQPQRHVWLWAALVPAVAIGADMLMRNFSFPLPLRIVLAALPLAPGAMFVRELRHLFTKGDELALKIVSEALSFVFFTLLGVFITVDLLENSGVLPGFVWNTMKLALTMAVLIGIGTLLSARRYR